MKKILLFLFAALAVCGSSVYAQEESRHEFAVSGGGGISNLNYGIFGGNNPLRFGGQVGLDYMYYITPRFSLGTGVEFGFYRNNPTLKNGLGMLSPLPTDEDCCTALLYQNLRVYGFEETQRTTTFNIPIMAQYLIPVGEKTNLYIRGGMKIGIPIVSTYDVNIRKAVTSAFNIDYYECCDGQMVYYGYEEFRIPGFGTRSDMSYSGVNKLKTSYSVSGEVGVKFRIADNMGMYVGGYIDYGLNNISKGPKYASLIDHFSVGQGCYDECGGPLPSYMPSAHSILQLEKAITPVKLISFGLKLRFSFGGCKTPAAPQVVYVDKVVEKIVERVVEVQPAPAPVVVPVVVPAVLTAEEEELLLKPVIFVQINRDSLSEFNRDLVSEVADIMKEKEWLKLRIEGHTCDIGTDEYNMLLGLRRAQTVADFLKAKGIAAERLETVSKGETNPPLPNTSDYNRSQNRRAEFKVIK